MTTVGYKRALVALSVVVVLLLACVWSLARRCGLQRADARAAWSAVVDYERSQRALSNMGVRDTVAYLDAITHASENASDRHLTMLMRQERARAVQDVIQELRKKTGENLGEDPEAWIRRYYQTTAAAAPASSPQGLVASHSIGRAGDVR